MRKKICILLSVILVTSIGIVAVCTLLYRPNQATGSALSDAEATSIEVSSSPAPRPELQEGQYLLRHRTEIHTMTVAKDVHWQNESNFSYGMIRDQQVDDTIEDQWRISVIPVENTNSYRITMRQREGSLQHEGGHAMSIMPSSTVSFSFRLDDDGTLTWDDREIDPIASQAYILLNHALSGIIRYEEENMWESFPFFEVWDDTSDLRAQYSPSFQGNQLRFDIQYSQPLNEQYIVNSYKSSQNDPFYSDMLPGASAELFYGNCQESNVQATASGTMTVDEENALLSSTEVTYSRNGYVIIPWSDDVFVQRLDLSTQAQHSIEVTNLDEYIDMDNSTY